MFYICMVYFLLPVMSSFICLLNLYPAYTVTGLFCCVSANLKLILISATVQHSSYE